GLGVHRRRRDPVLDYQCSSCGRVFNAWTGTPLEKTHRRPSQILEILRGILLRTSTAQMARDLKCQRAQLLTLRRRLEPLARALRGRTAGSKPAGVGEGGALEERSVSAESSPQALPDATRPEAQSASPNPPGVTSRVDPRHSSAAAPPRRQPSSR